MKPQTTRHHLLDIFDTALKAVEGRRCVADYLRANSPDTPVWVIAIGKAAASMAEGALDVLGDKVQAGLVITKYGYGDRQLMHDKRLYCLEAGHPFPDLNSLEAGRLLLDLLAQAPSDAQFLFLLSGGASALVEVLPQGVSLQDLKRANRWLLGSGLPIGKVNRVRKALSCIKDGRLRNFLAGREATCLLITDVPGNDLASIGSGPLYTSPITGQAIDLVLPDWLQAMVDKVCVPGAMIGRIVPHIVLADNMTARQAARARAEALGYPVWLHEQLIEGDAAETGARIATQLHHGPSGLHIWGAETTVVLPERPGRGGRCQHLALAAASVLLGHTQVTVLAAGTDGSDGPTEDAGALVDGETIVRGELAGLTAEKCLADADAGHFLAASDDLINTGPTGSNVMDLILGLKV